MWELKTFVTYIVDSPRDVQLGGPVLAWAIRVPQWLRLVRRLQPGFVINSIIDLTNTEYVLDSLSLTELWYSLDRL